MAGASSTVVRWMWTWIALGIVVVVVVIGFLIGITRSLATIDGGLFEAASSVENIGSNADPLPAQLEKINKALSSIDEVLKPIPGQGVEIDQGLIKVRDNLTTTNGALGEVASSLVDTNKSLAGTSATLVNVSDTAVKIDSSLADTTDILKTVLDRAQEIDKTLKSIQSEDSDGTASIINHIKITNGGLGAIRGDTEAITGGLKDVNHNLYAACTSPLLSLLPPSC